jgi:hypothetical protein
MKKIISVLIIGVLAVYFIITIIYSFPENYIKIKHKNTFTKFDYYFYQKWGFFAPPPKTNTQLFFTYRNIKNKKELFSIEVLSELYKEKRKKTFNTFEEILDYQLVGCCTAITSYIHEDFENKKNIYPDSTSQLLLNKAIQDYNKYNLDFPFFKTLLNYSKIILSKSKYKNLNKIEDLEVKITIVELPITKFSDAMLKSKSSIKQEMFVSFNSKYVKL